jgi:hypothetical protein
MGAIHGGPPLIVQRMNILEESTGSDAMFAVYPFHDGWM